VKVVITGSIQEAFAAYILVESGILLEIVFFMMKGEP
jgi:hypothetical protein